MANIRRRNAGQLRLPVPLGSAVLRTIVLAVLVLLVAFSCGRSAIESPGDCAGPLAGMGRSIANGAAVLGALLAALIGVVAALVRRKRGVLVAGLMVGLVLYGGFELGEATGTNACGPGGSAYVPPTTSQRANADLRLTDPIEAGDMTGTAFCARTQRGAPVYSIVSGELNVEPGSRHWRFGDDPPQFLEFVVVTTGSDRVWLRLLREPEDGQEGIAVYTEASGGSVEVTASDDSAAGSLTFNGLGRRDVPVGDPSLFPAALSGAVTWTCVGPEVED